MVGGATNQQPQMPPPAPLPPSSPTPMTEEDEFLKRNTDCVYFLASPLTCKKGSECEYRHSDIARVNPRDCWYWLNGNCLNPKCAFRHPPLDVLLGAEVPTPVTHCILQVPVTPAQQRVACIFFQKGFCLKGHHCPFLHGPPIVVNNKPVQPVPPNSVTKSAKMAYAGQEKFIQEQNLAQQESIQKPIESLPSEVKYAPGMQGINGGAFVMEKKVAPPPEEPPRHRSGNVGPPPVTSEFHVSMSNHGGYESNHVSDNEGINGKDADEYSREPTPGFDVLVDTEVGDSEYYPNEEQIGRSRGQDFDMGRPSDYDVDRDMYPEQFEYDHYNKEGYAWDDHRDSSNFGRERYHRDDILDQFDQSDLRHRISKQRRVNNAGGLRSVVSREHPHDIDADRMPRRDSHHDHQYRRLEPGSLSSRLRGRIKIPGRSTLPGNGNELRVEREFDMGRQHRSRYSPGRPPHVSSNHSRLRDRIKGNDYNYERRNYRGSRGSDNSSEFAGPRRLSELKSQQTDDGQSLGKRKYPRTDSQQSEVNVSFEGPKPLSEILKRKRGSVICVVNNEDSNSNHQEINEKSMDVQASLNDEVNDVENKVGSVDEDAMLDQDHQYLEADDHRDGYYYYDEQIDGEEYNLEEGEEYVYEEEGDETAKKENEVYS